MELDRAFELAVMSCWDELVKSAEPCSIQVEYKNLSGLPVRLVEVWTIRKRGYGKLAFRYVSPESDASIPHVEVAEMQFANSYRSDTLANSLDFIMRNQASFTRPIDHSSHGLIQIETPNEQDRERSELWLASIRTLPDARQTQGGAAVIH
jgi:hypothetical protein